MSSRENFEKLVELGRLKRENPSATAIGNHIAKAKNLLADAQNAAGSLDGRFNNAYAAGHQFLTAALKMKGYRPTEGQGGRSILYQLLDRLVPGAAGSQRLLGRMHDLRNKEEYDDPMQLTDSLVSDVIAAVQNVGEEANAEWKAFSKRNDPQAEKRRPPPGGRSK